jgi:hypothetical protein
MVWDHAYGWALLVAMLNPLVLLPELVAYLESHPLAQNDVPHIFKMQI